MIIPPISELKSVEIFSKIDSSIRFNGSKRRFHHILSDFSGNPEPVDSVKKPNRYDPTHTYSIRLIPTRSVSRLLEPTHTYSIRLIPTRSVSYLLDPSHAYSSRLIPSRSVSRLLDPTLPWGDFFFCLLIVTLNFLKYCVFFFPL